MMKFEDAGFQAVLSRAMDCLARRDYGTKELRQKLLSPKPNSVLPNEDDVDRALERLTELGLLNDERRAAQLTEALRRKGYGPQKISFELRQRSLEAMPEPEEDNSEAIAALLRTKYAAKLGDERGRRSAFQALVRRGFRYAEIKLAMSAFADEMCDTGEDFDED